jgi:hypothetical protein
LWPAGFNKDPSVLAKWSLTSPGNTPVQLCSIPTLKVHLQVFKKLENLGKITFLSKQKSEKVLSKITLGNSVFAKCEIQHFCWSNELSTYSTTTVL